MKNKVKNLWSQFEQGALDFTRKYDDEFIGGNIIRPRDHIMLLAVALCVLIFIIWANIAKIDQAAKGQGRVIPSSEIQVIQLLEGGIIDEFLVQEGQVVEKGQVLVRMRDVGVRSEFGANQAQYLGLLATATRLKAEAEGKTSLKFPKKLIQSAPDSVQSEMKAFEANRDQYTRQLNILQEQQRQREQEVKELKKRIQDVSKVVALSKKEQSMIAPMVSKGAVPEIELLQIEKQIAEQESELNSTRLALPRSEAAVKEARERVEEHVSATRAQAQQELAALTVELKTLNEQSTAIADRKFRTEVRSPARGTVKDIKITTVGGVVAPGEQLMEVVPLGDKLVIETNISPSDIAFLYPGQPAIVKITAYDFGVYGGLDGKVVDISPDAITNEQGESFYRVKVHTDQSEIKHKGETLAILPGMVAQVDILTRKKTVMQYLLKPFTKAANEALREN